MLSKADVRNLVVLVLGVLLVLVLVSPARTFPMIDDWIYSRSVSDLLAWNYHPPQQAQANLMSHVAWGALFAAALGLSFTVLSLATLTASTIGLAAFYLLLRHLSVSPGAALLGAATLGLNPLYIYLSYSFMTDVTFLTCLLLGCLFYVRGFQGRGELWLWLGGLMASIAYLARQPGALLVVAAIAYLFWSRKWTRRNALAVAALPVAAALVFTLWERSQPTTVLSGLVSNMAVDILSNPPGYLLLRAPFIGLALTPLGLYIAPCLLRPRRITLACPPFVLLAALIFVNTHYIGSAFPPDGNVLDHTGFVMWLYNAAPIWSESLWAIIDIGSALLLSLYVAALIERAFRRSKPRRWFRRDAEHNTGPAWMLYVLAVLMTGLVVGVTPALYDRYMLPVLPMLMVPALLRISATDHSTNKLVSVVFLRWATVALLATFSIICMRDYMEHATVRWQAANRLAEHGTARDQIDAGFEWQGVYWQQPVIADHSQAARTVDESVIPYKVSDRLLEGYELIDSLPYMSWLMGGETRHVLLLHRK